MQSYLQHRALRRALEAQVPRDKEKAHRAAHDQQDSSPAEHGIGSPRSDVTDEDFAEKNLEKGDVAAERRRDQRSRKATPTDAPGQLSGDSSAQEKQQRSQAEPPARAGNAAVEEAEEHEQEEEEEEGDGGDYELAHNRTALSRASTQGSTGTVLGRMMTGVEVRKRSTREGGEGQVFVVGFEGDDDPNNPHNWPLMKKVRATMIVAAIGCVVGIASSIDSEALPQASKEFGVSEVVESLGGTGIFLIGFGCGSLFAGPISETVGRNPVYISTMLLFMIFEMAAALSPNIGAQLAFRFIGGCFASTPLVCAGGTISDVWSPLERVYAFPVFANAAFTGPALGPVIGGYIAQSPLLSWRWTDWITLITAGLVLGLTVLFLPETYPQTLLKWKAENLRAITGDNRFRAYIEIREETFLHRLGRALYRPFVLTAREPIIILFALYLTVVYIILFTFFDGYTYIFQETYGISQGLTGICFVGIVIGLFGASLLVPLIYKWAKDELRKVQEQGGDRLPPEFRLWYTMLGGAFAIPISLFWMGWTAFPSISIWSPLVSSVLFGYGILCVFISSYQYIIDTYETYAASALASMTLIRYFAAGGMTVVGIPFYENLGVHYTLTILACISAAMVPVPYLFYIYGPWVRSKSKYAVTSN